MVRIAFLATLLLLTSCQNAPSTAQKNEAVNLMPIESMLDFYAEKHIGLALFQKTISNYPLWYHKDVSRYLAEVGSHVSMYSLRNDISYSFYIVDSKDVFSLGLPSGIVVVSLGLLEHIQTESELACILGLEVAKIEHQYLLRIMNPAKDDFTQNWLKNSEEIANAYALVLTHRFSDENINESDRLGMIYAQHFGYRASDLQVLLTRFYQDQIQRKSKTTYLGQYSESIVAHRQSYGEILVKELEKEQSKFPTRKNRFDSYKPFLTK